jgi:uncharacterized protein (TIGR02001 family)
MMKKRLQHLALATALAGSTAVFSTNALAYEATLSGNAGILSDYIYRGIPQDTGVGNGGVDLEIGGFYLGTWIADVGTGVEYDIYGGYVHEFVNGMYLGAGYTTYQYSDSFDRPYNEFNIVAGWSNDVWSIDLEYSPGEYEGNFIDDNGNIEGDNYEFYAATVGWNGVYLTYGGFGDDAEDSLGDYLELGYGFEVAGFDVTAAVVHTDLGDNPAGLVSDNGTNDDGDETQAYVGIHRSFDIMKWGSGS